MGRRMWILLAGCTAALSACQDDATAPQPTYAPLAERSAPERAGLAADKYASRTTPLRNVELTGPYGHAGQFVGLRAFVDHYGESHLKLRSYDASQLEPALRGTLVDNVDDVLAMRDPILDGVVLPSDVVDKLTAYMRALTDGAARDMGRVAPDRVPSGLPVDRP